MPIERRGIPRDLYEKVGRRYRRVGHEFEGFPANGYWQVKDGRESLIVPVDHPRPLELLRYAQHQNEIMSAFCKADPMSYNVAMVVEFTLKWLEAHAHESAKLT